MSEGRFWKLHDSWVDLSFARPRRAAMALALILAPAVVLSVQLFQNIHAGLEDLLPEDAPIVRSLHKIHEVMSGKSSVIVIASSPDAEVNRRFIEQLGQHLEAHPLAKVRSLSYDVTEERRWGYERAPLLMGDEDFAALMKQADEAAAAARARANPLLIRFDDPEDGAPDWEAIRRTIREKTAAYDRFPRGFLETPDGKTVVAVLWLKGSETEIDDATALMTGLKREVDAIRASYPRTLRVAYNGEVVNLIEEHDAILADLSLSSAVVLLLVGTAIALYFRSKRAVVATLLSIVPGLLVSFALARLTVGGLNSNTAFLGSIIAGNGINFPLVLLAYFRQQPASLEPAVALKRAARQGFAGTLGAAVCASAAYGGLALSDFRGFSEFGWLGGMGMVTVWFFTLVTLPLVVRLLKPRHGMERSTRAQGIVRGFFARPRLSLGVAVGILALGFVWIGFGVHAGSADGLYEMNLRALRNRDSIAHGGASWDKKMNEVFGVWLNPVGGLAMDPSHREELATRLRAALTSGDPAPAERVETIATFVPPLEKQEERLRRLRKLGRSYQKARAEVPADVRDVLDRWFTPHALTPITVAEVPSSLREPFAEDSGRTDRVVLVYPSLEIDYDDGRNVIHFADVLNSVNLPPDAVVGGGFLFMAEVLRLVHDQAMRVVLIVCGLVALALLPTFGRKAWRIPLTVGITSIVAFGSMAQMLALGVRVNLLNFAAIPITIGVGSDYLVNLFGAMDALRANAREATVRMGGAIFLCSLTTIIGYFSLVMAQSGALRTFGWAAILGEIAAVLVVLLVFPVLGGITARVGQVAGVGDGQVS